MIIARVVLVVLGKFIRSDLGIDFLYIYSPFVLLLVDTILEVVFKYFFFRPSSSTS